MSRAPHPAMSPQSRSSSFYTCPFSGRSELLILNTCMITGRLIFRQTNSHSDKKTDQTVLGSNPAVAAALSPWTRLFTPIVPRRSLHISFYLAILVKYILAKKKSRLKRLVVFFRKSCAGPYPRAFGGGGGGKNPPAPATKVHPAKRFFLDFYALFVSGPFCNPSARMHKIAGFGFLFPKYSRGSMPPNPLEKLHSSTFWSTQRQQEPTRLNSFVRP